MVKKFAVLACLFIHLFPIGLNLEITNVIPISSKHDNYVLVFNAGSTGTRLSLFKVITSSNSTFESDIREVFFCEKKDIGLHQYGSSREVEQNLDDCVSKADEKVPDELKSQTPIYLVATAGMRLLEASNKSKSDQILNWVRNYFKSTGFFFDHPNQARIIEGWEEGMFTLLAALSAGPRVKGTIQIGGASAQFTFFTDFYGSPPPNEIHKVTLGNATYSIYSHSYLCRGMAQMTNMYVAKNVRDSAYSLEPIRAACFPLGFSLRLRGEKLANSECTNGALFDSSWPFTLANSDIDPTATYTLVGASDPRRCEEEILEMMPDVTCPFGDDLCGVDGVFQPPIPDFDFVATTRIIQSVKSLVKLVGQELNGDFGKFSKMIDSLGSKSFKELKEINLKNGVGTKDDELGVIAFQNTYLVRLLQKFGFKSFENINLTKYDPKNPTFVNWILGFVINGLRIKE